MTDLAKPVRRRCREQFAHYRKRIVVSLEPGDVLAMRLERTRTTYRPLFSAALRSHFAASVVSFGTPSPFA
jgi:hypothetical protein